MLVVAAVVWGAPEELAMEGPGALGDPEGLVVPEESEEPEGSEVAQA